MRRSHRPAPVLAIFTLTLSTLALTALLAACSGGASAPNTTPPDTTAPSLTITSQTSATSATYHLKGKTTDNVAATKITYSVDGGPPKTVALTGGTFDITVTLQAGQNTIDVKVFDAAGNVKDVVFHVTYTPANDRLGITVAGLSGVQADVTVTGPQGYSHHLAATGTLSGLVDGTYTVAASNVTGGGIVYVPSPQTQTVSVQGGQTGHATVTYAVQSGTAGSLAITVSGVPSGDTASVSVTGPGGYASSVSSTTTLNALDPGSYSVTASDITESVSGDVYAATVTGSPADVQAGATRSVSVVYARVTAHLSIDVSGLPSGTSPSVDVTGPGGYATQVTSSGTTVLTGLRDGTYALTAHEVTAGSSAYAASPSSESIPLAVGQDGSATFGYSIQTSSSGRLTVNVSGLVNGTAADVTVSGPGGYAKTLTATTTLTGLTPGNYALSVHDVTGTSYDYTGSANPGTVDVPSGGSATTDVTYHATTVAITVTVAGLSTGIAADITLTDPNGATHAVSQTVTLTHLPAGGYAIQPNDVDGPHYTWRGASDFTSLYLNAGHTGTFHVTYQPNDGELVVNVSGLPSGLGGDVDVNSGGILLSGYGGETSSFSIPRLAPTTYGIVVHAVQDSSYRYSYNGGINDPESLSATVQAGQTKTIDVTYTAETGNLFVTVDGGGGTFAPDVTVTGSLQPGVMPDNFTKHVTTLGTTELKYAPQEEYTLTGTSGIHGYPYTYDPLGTSQGETLAVLAGRPTDVTFHYVPTDGALSIAWSGIPSGQSYSATVVDSNGASHHVTAFGGTSMSSTVAYLPVGTATVNADSVPICVNHKPYVYVGSVAPSATPTISVGTTTPLTISYTRVTGIGTC